MSRTYNRIGQLREERRAEHPALMNVERGDLRYSFRGKSPGRVTLSDRQTKSVKEVSAEVVRVLMLEKCYPRAGQRELSRWPR